MNATNPLAVVQPFNVQTQGVVSGHPSYFDFIAPGIMAMTVMMSVMTGLPVAISQEKEIGTMDGMMVAPVNRLSILLGKTMAQTGRGLIQGVIILALAIGIFGVAIQGSILLVFALLLLGVFSFVGLGIVITSFTKDQETAQMLMMTLMFPMMFLGGVFFPIQQMPWYMQDISKAATLNVCFRCSTKSHGARRRHTADIHRTHNTHSVRCSHDCNCIASVPKNDDKIGELENEYTLLQMPFLPTRPTFKTQKRTQTMPH